MAVHIPCLFSKSQIVNRISPIADLRSQIFYESCFRERIISPAWYADVCMGKLNCGYTVVINKFVCKTTYSEFRMLVIKLKFILVDLLFSMDFKNFLEVKAKNQEFHLL